MKIAILDAKTIGDDIPTKPIEELGECTVYQSTSPSEVSQRLADCDVAVLNKVKLNETNLKDAKNLKLICLLATGYDNVDLDYCRKRRIAVCNVEGYSSHSVSQITVSMVLYLASHLKEYADYVKSGSYTVSGVANRLSPVYSELNGKTWGIAGFGNIGMQVGKVAEALGCKVIVYKKTPIDGYTCTDIDTLCKKSDIISLHLPLCEETYHIINEDRIAKMKKNVILVNMARGNVTDEDAVARGVINADIGAFGCDVFSVEPFGTDHPFNQIKDLPNVILTPHMAWGAYESRLRCVDEVRQNIASFFQGEIRNRVDLF